MHHKLGLYVKYLGNSDLSVKNRVRAVILKVFCQFHKTSHTHVSLPKGVS